MQSAALCGRQSCLQAAFQAAVQQTTHAVRTYSSGFVFAGIPQRSLRNSSRIGNGGLKGRLQARLPAARMAKVQRRPFRLPSQALEISSQFIGESKWGRQSCGSHAWQSCPSSMALRATKGNENSRRPITNRQHTIRPHMRGPAGPDEGRPHERRNQERRQAQGEDLCKRPFHLSHLQVGYYQLDCK